MLPVFPHFNSTMVRLKVLGLFYRSGPLLFQFHYGSIKGGNGFFDILYERYFNSTMVRLKVIVRLNPLIFSLYFNSTMVRLKATPRFFASSSTKFQFHYGSIKGNFSGWRLTGKTIFQFHYGSIKGIFGRLCRFLYFLFQFHYGSIKGNYEQKNGTGVVISIPLWFD